MMRTLVERFLWGSLLDLEDGTSVYYPNSATGPGHSLGQEQRAALVRNHALAFWVLAAIFVFPQDFLGAQLSKAIGDTSVVAVSAWVLALAPFLLLVWCLIRRSNKLLNRSERRAPACWDEDLGRLRAKETEDKPGILLPGLGAIFIILIAIILGALLESFLDP